MDWKTKAPEQMEFEDPLEQSIEIASQISKLLYLCQYSSLSIKSKSMAAKTPFILFYILFY